MNTLLKNIRFYLLCSTIVLILALYTGIAFLVPEGSLRIVKLTQAYSFLALIYLYLSLLPSPLYSAFPRFPFRTQFTHARRALGVSAFLFSLLHSLISFFSQLGGFSGLGFLDSSYWWAIGFGGISLLILTLMAATSLDVVIRWLSFPRWKWLHRLVYPAGILIILHVLMLGSHFSNLTSFIPQLSFLLLATLLFLEAVRIDISLSKSQLDLPRFGIATLIVASLISFLPRYFLSASSNPSTGLNVHAQHIQLAQQAQQTKLPTFAGLRGDPTRRFTVSFIHPDSIAANQPAALSFQVYDASSGNPQDLYTKVYGKFVHLVIVDESLNYFSHIHPTFQDHKFVINPSFPHDGIYHLYINYQPFGAIEQQQAFTLTVGNPSTLESANQPVETNLTKTFDGQQVTLSSSAPLKAADLAVGKQTISFTLKDGATGQPTTNLKPYLEAYGHLVLINEETYDYIHVHPNDLTVPAPDQSGGPTVTFLPLGLYGPIKAGVYRAFAEFNPGGHLITTNFTIRIQ